MSTLEKLGASLTNAVRKLIKSTVVDEATVKELVRDFQRALLQADVNVQLVLDLSKRIETRALSEKIPPGISRREHVVKVLYEELTKFLGERPTTIQVEAGKPNVFMLVGIQGSGKCVIGNTLIQLVEGQVRIIADLFEDYISHTNNVITLQDGIAISPRNLKVYSVNIETLKIEEKNVEWIWKLRSTEELYEVQLDLDLKVTTTPEHPFFTMENGAIKQVRADCLKKGQSVMVQLPLLNVQVNEYSSTGYQLNNRPVIQQLISKTKAPFEKQISWSKVNNINNITNHSIKYVYDLTIRDNHNFVANNIVIHNTTSAAKLARYFQKRGFKTGLICADTFRLGAYDQLKQLAEKIKVPIYGNLDEKVSLKIAREGVEQFRRDKFEVIILDTAGRHKDETNLMKEMSDIATVVNPDEVILVIDATIGQQASVQAQVFHDATSIGSIILSKVDGSARGGGALSSVIATGVPIKFIGVGEDVRAIEPFVPSRFVGRLLGMGDIEGLVQRVREAEVTVPKRKAKAILKGRFTLVDMYEQIEAMSNIGPLGRVLKMVPGISYNIPDDAVGIAEDKMKRWKYIIQSMTKDERENPKILNSSRIKRVARGSGTNEKEVKDLIKQHSTMKKFLRSMGKRKIPPFFRKMFGQIK